MPKSIAAAGSPHAALHLRRFDRLSDTRADRGEILTWARALMDPGSKVLLLKPDNTKDRRVTLEEAVLRRRPFAVKVRDDVLAIDSDKPELLDALLHLEQVLRQGGLQPFVLRSGRRGHAHLWCGVPGRTLLARYKNQARQAGFDVREGRSLCRPPFAPHRQGRPLGLLFNLKAPADQKRWEKALLDIGREQRKQEIETTWRGITGDPSWVLPGRQFVQTPAPEHHDAAAAPSTEAAAAVIPPPSTTAAPAPPRRRLNPKMERLLRDGLPKGQRSEGIQAVALAAVNRGWTEAQFSAELLDPPKQAWGQGP
jgi:hypothetical protein